MDLPLDNLRKRGLLLAACALLATLFCYQAIGLELASRDIRSGDPVRMKKAVALEPGYADYWDEMGRFLQFDLDDPDLQGALQNYETAVKLSPLTARYWTDLAVAHENLGNVAQARQDFARALAAYPASAEVHWEYGNFLLRQEELPAALGEMRVAVMQDRKLLPLAITRAWRATEDANQLAASVLPPEPQAYIEALNYFASEKNVDPGLKIWNHLAQLRQPFDIGAVFPFLDELIREGRGADGERVWLEALAACGLPHDPPADRSVVWNGGFERDMLNGGFDWRMAPLPGMGVEYDTNIYHEGRRSLRMDFDGGANINLVEPFQFVAVESNLTYHFQGYVRTEALTTESGLGFYLIDPDHQDSIYLPTVRLTGSHPWTVLAGDIHTGPDTHILQITVRRQQSRLFENRLSGTAWIDDVSLIPATGDATPETSPGVTSQGAP
ncbi:MAG: tetratricopeptide repeat protein [Candidatus Acidiferrales bacterium]